MKPHTWKVDGIIAVALLACGAAVYGLGIQPAAASRRSLDAVQALLSEEQLRASTSTTEVHEARREVADLQAKLSRQEVQLKASSETNTTLANLAMVVKEHGLKVLEIAPGDARSADRFTLVPVRLRASGSYVDCANTLAAIKRSLPDIGVDGLTLRADRGVSGAELMVELVWYAAPMSKNAGGAASAAADTKFDR